jgi:20S proteasome subunit beta 1
MNRLNRLRVFAFSLATMCITIATTTCNAIEQVSMGTTIFAVRYRDGVVVGADSRTSVSGYVSNRYATKISFVLEDDFGIDLAPPSDVQLNSALLDPEHKQGIQSQRMEQQASSSVKSTCCICRSGSAADTQYIADAVRHQLLRRKVMQHSSSSISNVANLIKTYLHNNELQASLICAGYDHIRDEGAIYSIDLGGTCMEQPQYACNGSGSGYIMGHIDEHFNTMGMSCSTMTESEAIEFVGNTIELAMDRDGSSGGVVRIYVIDRNGKKEILRTPKKYSDMAERAADGEDESNLAQFAPPVRR